VRSLRPHARPASATQLEPAGLLRNPLHALLACCLFALWPFTRLVHVFSAPVGYLTRPYIVYRSRDVQLGARGARRGWERSG
jgi:nitrate reductase gamma subunit